MWGWYREWSKVVQSSITDRRVLRRLGFLKAVRSASAVDSELVTDADEDTEDLIIDDTDEATAVGGVPTTTVTVPRAAPSGPKKVAAKKKAPAKRKTRRR
jgi:hypothetical protein